VRPGYISPAVSFFGNLLLREFSDFLTFFSALLRIKG